MSPRIFAAAFVSLLAAASGASGQATQAEAFADGKAHKPKNVDIQNGINAGALTNVPGQDATTTNDLKSMYGSNLINQGQSKVAACASYVPGSDAYKNQECETVNYMVGNPSARPQYVIDKVNDPLVVTSGNISNTPGTHTAGTSGLAGNYSACVNQTTNQPAKYDTERCQVGRPVTEGRCATTLNVTYTWQSFANQPGADMRYGRCGAGEVRSNENCFTPAGIFSAKVQVPVFVDNWDYSACADLTAHGAVIQN